MAITFAAALFLTAGYAVAKAPARTNDQQVTRTVAYRYRGHTAATWAKRFRHRTRQLQVVRAHTRRRWAPTVDYALQLASTIYRVSYWELHAVASCESHLYPFARNGQYRGLFQEGPMFERGPFAMFGVFDPIANALTAAHTVAREGWSQWECKP